MGVWVGVSVQIPVSLCMYDVKIVCNNDVHISTHAATFIHACMHYRLVSNMMQSNDVTSQDMQDAKGKTALMYACKLGNLEAAKALVMNGADPHLKTTVCVVEFTRVCATGTICMLYIFPCIVDLRIC